MFFDNFFLKKLNKKYTKTDSITTVNVDLIKSILDNPWNDKKNEHLLMCFLSGIIYYYNKGLPEICELYGLDDYTIHVEGDGIGDNPILVYLIFVIKERIIVVFKGTNNLEDDLNNLKFTVSDLDVRIPGKFHQGFYDILFDENRYCNVISNINDHMYHSPIDSEKFIYITGHSLGGALATLFYSYLQNNVLGYEFNLITFGSPKVGNPTFANSITNCTRIVNERDLIPSLPFSLSCFGDYTHVSKKKQLYGIGSPFYKPWNLEDHSIYNYFKNLLDSK